METHVPRKTRSRPRRPKTRKKPMKGSSVIAERVKQRKRLEEVQREIEDISRQLENTKNINEVVKLRKLLAEKEQERGKLYHLTKQEVNLDAVNMVKTSGLPLNAVNLDAVNMVKTSGLPLNTVNLDAVNQGLNLNAVNLDAVNQGLNLDAVNLDAVDLNAVNAAPLKLQNRRARNRETRKLAKEKAKMVTLLESKPIRVNPPKLKFSDRKGIAELMLLKSDLLRQHNALDRVKERAARQKKNAELEEIQGLLKQMETKWENPIQKKEREEQKALERTQHEHYLKNKNMSKMMSKEDIKKMIKNYAKKN